MTGNYENLLVWQKSIDLSVKIFERTKNFPKEEIYGLVSQIRRCSFSIPSNIAEGSQRNSDKEFARFVSIALGSNAELKTQIIISFKTKIMSESEFNYLLKDIDEVAKMLSALRKKLIASSQKLEAAG
ncbi:MAG: hypothetical protein COV36_00970 [Alphaproteobacteria bacterium CG11_big_fil_rev_8_21_14_0_20_44_7]|nr:MAG: hypothetical protein COV36_00970 [Alphaproteobacteria bacterium CG11_big_fil_rev_8_21_14_0_20_44_7]